MGTRGETAGTAPGLKSDFLAHPTLRDLNLPSSELWLEGRRIDDDVSPYWRVHDQLYDLTEFMDKHPGGRHWIERTQGTDITEQFECHHVNHRKANMMLKQYLVKETDKPRNSPYTFKEDGFYRTLQTRAWQVLRHIPPGPSRQSKLLADAVFSCFAVLAIVSVRSDSLFLAGVAGAVLSLLLGCGHSFFHIRDTWRTLYFDLSLFSSASWQVSHAMSHHCYPNSPLDLEVSALEPMLIFWPRSKTQLPFVVNFAIQQLVSSMAAPYEFLSRVVYTLQGREPFRKRQLVLLAEVAVLAAVAEPTLSWGRFAVLCAAIQLGCSWTFLLTSLIAGTHHHDSIWHSGDKPELLDFGVMQMEATRDRKEVSASFLLRTWWFGDHALHHCFPTVDMWLLPKLRPALQQTCEEFGVEFKEITMVEAAKGYFRQLVRVKPHQQSGLVAKKTTSGSQEQCREADSLGRATKRRSRRSRRVD